MRKHGARSASQLGKLLRVHYNTIVNEPLPERWIELIRALTERGQFTRDKDNDPDGGAAPEGKEH